MDFNKGIHYLKRDSLHNIKSFALSQKYFPTAESVGTDSIFLVSFMGREYGRFYIAGDTVRRNAFYNSVSNAHRNGEIVYCDFDRAIIWEPGKLSLVEKGRPATIPLPVKAETIKRLYYLLSGNWPFYYQGKIFFKTGQASYEFVDCLHRRMAKLNVSGMGATRVSRLKCWNHEISFTTDRGLVVLDTNLEVKDSVPFPPGLNRNTVAEMIKDRAGNIWIATCNDGLYLLPAFYRNVHRLTLPTDASMMKCVRVGVRQYCLDDEGNLLELEHDHYRQRIVLPDRTSPGRAPENITLRPDKHGGLYIASIKGMFYRDAQGRIMDMSYLKHPRDNWTVSVKDAFYDAAEDRYYFLLYNKLCAYSPSGGLDDNILAGRYNHVALAGEHELWLANDDGITSWQKNIAKGKVLLTAPKQISTLQISDMVADPAGNVVAQVNGRGVFVFSKKKQAPGIIPEPTVQLIKMTGNGLWVASAKGIKLLTWHNDVYHVKRFIPNIRGVLYDEVADLLDDSVDVTLVTKNGMLRCPLEGIAYRDPYFTEKPFVSLYSARDGNITGTVLQKNWERSGLLFRFSANSVSYLGNISYEYYLEGFDFSMQVTTAQTVSYPVLPPGRYTFHLTARVNDLGITSATTTILLIIKPRWWQSVWLKVGLALFLLICIYLLFEWRLRRYRSKLKLQAHLKSRAAQMELRALQSQMNPHFIFNALSAVKSHFKFNKIAEAEQLLEDFSRLIRLYLEFSGSPFISFQQELAALQLYTDIERRRFDNKFIVLFRIRVRQGGYPLWQIPPMILQPIVENAINHGLYRKPGRNGQLKIFFIEQEHMLTVVVDDNGIGRIRAAEIGQSMPRAYPSKGNNLVTDRIQVLKATGKTRIEHEIRDKYDRDNIACGTRVIIRFFLNDYDKSDHYRRRKAAGRLFEGDNSRDGHRD
ncbi:sensor histidine kinase [Taibaiella koreensis]|uniref:sensor histidine kinase n=1 Tax=Taibaiella koreensis TaxID=1268548 RepID=UPI001F098550|nr:sensor histidine kinase [Taibaiella koreensis]